MDMWSKFWTALRLKVPIPTHLSNSSTPDFRRPQLALLLLLLLTACGEKVMRHPTVGGKPWIVISTDRVEVLTTLDAARAAEVTALLHADADALAKEAIQCPRAVPPLKPARVVLLSNEREFQEIRPRRNTGAFFMSKNTMLSAPEPLLVLPWTEFFETGKFRHTFLHEYTHRLVNRCWPNMPLWLNEGLAEYYGTLEVHEGRLITGTPAYVFVEYSTEHVFYDRQWVKYLPVRAFTSLEELRNPGGHGLYDASPLRVSMRYASSWGYTHFLMSGPHKQRFRQFLRALSSPDAKPNLWNVHFSGIESNFREEALAYLKPDSLQTESRAMSQTLRVTLRKRPMSDWESGLLLSQLFANNDPERSAALFEEVLQRTPHQTTAIVTKADALAFEDKFDEAEALLLQAQAAHAEPERELLLALGYLYTEQGKPSIHRLLEHHESLLKLSETEADSELLNALAWSHFALDEREASKQALSSALQLNPACWTCYRTRALRLQAEGKWAAAAEAYNTAASVVGENALWRQRSLVQKRDAARKQAER